MLLLILLVALGGWPAAGGTQPPDPVEQIEDYYLTGRLDRAELEALRLLNKTSGLAPYQRAELFRILAFSAVARDDTELASTYFRSALQENPNLRLDRNLTSPKILSVFDQARMDFTQVQIMDREMLVQELKANRLRREGGQRSMLLPGLGQLHKGQALRGNLILGSASICLVGLAYTQVMVMDSQDRYERADTPVKAVATYDDLQQYWRWRSGFATAYGLIWLGSVLEAFISDPNPSAFDQIRIEMAFDPVSGTPMAGLAFEF